MTFVYETKMGGKHLVVEYCLSSVTDSIKIVDMTADGKFHRFNWMNEVGQKKLMDNLEKDYLDNHSMFNHPDFDAAMNGLGLS